MLEILQFIFSSFWIWLGTLLLLGVIVKGIIAVIAIMSGRDVNIH